MNIHGFLFGSFLFTMPVIAFLWSRYIAPKTHCEASEALAFVPKSRLEFMLSLSQITGIVYIGVNAAILKGLIRFSNDLFGVIALLCSILGPLIVFPIGIGLVGHRFPK